jgi:spore cortex formation protein SpoVR/YcgB (stage V sporulation)
MDVRADSSVRPEKSRRLAGGVFRLDTYPNQIEVIRSDQMLDAYASIGMPLGYHHWSFGKHFVESERRLSARLHGLATRS